MRFNSKLTAAGLFASFVTFNAEASLINYESSSIKLVYSDISNLTWTADANLFGTLVNRLGFDNLVNSIITVSPSINNLANYHDGNTGNYQITVTDFNSNSPGLMTWFGAKAFISYLNQISYGSSNEWSLPDIGHDPKFGFQNNSQFGQLFYKELGGSGIAPVAVFNNFDNPQLSAYWFNNESGIRSSLPYSSMPQYAWYFDFYGGWQEGLDKGSFSYVWAVNPNHLTEIPLPEALWLMGAGLFVMLNSKRLMKIFF